MIKTFPRRYWIPSIAIGSIVLGIGFSLFSNDSGAASSTHKFIPASSSFTHSVSGSGIIEANTRNISIGSHLSGIITEVLVTEGQTVITGQPLFRLDDREVKSEIATLKNDVAMVAAQLEEAKISLADQEDQLRRVESLKAGVAVTVDRVKRLQFAKRSAEARVNVTQANLAVAEARVAAAETTLEKLTVTAPVDGRIFKVDARVGEFVQAGTNEHPPIVMGNDTPLYVRVTIDENDIWRFKDTAEAVGMLRSNRDMKFPLTFVRIQPYVVPKTSLTGSASERVDTRVLEIVYSIDATDIPVYIGQQVDVFINADAKSPEAAKVDTSAK